MILNTHSTLAERLQDAMARRRRAVQRGDLQQASQIKEQINHLRNLIDNRLNNRK